MLKGLAIGACVTYYGVLGFTQELYFKRGLVLAGLARKIARGLISCFRGCA
ncbi:hypothetical protein HHE02_12580 [Helicobacter heilmannii]|uniref:Uncharacterized protein n=1 Tax=Helicobacter heilmannii TaxID=35817 RepID=A0A0K2XQX6_HELHE|nr:hypothetical protein BN341_4120 [Helicobacter heilmannii ASB1.4]CRF46735.1 hypothetical protein HHE014_17600 [Helicobacter heilmannii]CRF47956.1 hypothetical protein HHE02_12580 [Helicobacter heilmannii]CRF49531.1 hypothetical protein HHE03_11520 [Helicobacter heilmannii]CRF50192.1 hypothetical protein HHE06_00100 [Helicobacter heilmannii]